jgi:hypothetical protein
LLRRLRLFTIQTRISGSQVGRGQTGASNKKIEFDIVYLNMLAKPIYPEFDRERGPGIGK